MLTSNFSTQSVESPEPKVPGLLLLQAGPLPSERRTLDGQATRLTFPKVQVGGSHVHFDCG